MRKYSMNIMKEIEKQRWIQQINPILDILPTDIIASIPKKILVDIRKIIGNIMDVVDNQNEQITFKMEREKKVEVQKIEDILNNINSVSIHVPKPVSVITQNLDPIFETIINTLTTELSNIKIKKSIQTNQIQTSIISLLNTIPDVTISNKIVTKVDIDNTINTILDIVNSNPIVATIPKEIDEYLGDLLEVVIEEVIDIINDIKITVDKPIQTANIINTIDDILNTISTGQVASIHLNTTIDIQKIIDEMLTLLEFDNPIATISKPVVVNINDIDPFFDIITTTQQNLLDIKIKKPEINVNIDIDPFFDIITTTQQNLLDIKIKKPEINVNIDIDPFFDIIKTTEENLPLVQMKTQKTFVNMKALNNILNPVVFTDNPPDENVFDIRPPLPPKHDLPQYELPIPPSRTIFPIPPIKIPKPITYKDIDTTIDSIVQLFKPPITFEISKEIIVEIDSNIQSIIDLMDSIPNPIYIKDSRLATIVSESLKNKPERKEKNDKYGLIIYEFEIYGKIKSMIHLIQILFTIQKIYPPKKENVSKKENGDNDINKYVLKKTITYGNLEDDNDPAYIFEEFTNENKRTLNPMPELNDLPVHGLDQENSTKIKDFIKDFNTISETKGPTIELHYTLIKKDNVEYYDLHYSMYPYFNDKSYPKYVLHKEDIDNNSSNVLIFFMNLFWEYNTLFNLQKLN